MEDKYHHENLRQILIEEGLKMVSTEGITSFSMRKLANSLGVSHTAAYRHFKDKNSLLTAISQYCSKKFYDEVSAAVCEIKDPYKRIYELGVHYVLFFVKKPEMLTLFNLNATLKVDNRAVPQDSLSNSFLIFEQIAKSIPRTNEYSKLNDYEILLGFWSKVHGLASLLIVQKDFLPQMNDKDLEQMIRNIISVQF